MIDGTDSTVHDFGPPLAWHEEAKFTLSTLLLGHVICSDESKPSNMNTSFYGGYEIGNVLIFAGKITKRSCCWFECYWKSNQSDVKSINCKPGLTLSIFLVCSFFLQSAV